MTAKNEQYGSTLHRLWGVLTEDTSVYHYDVLDILLLVVTMNAMWERQCNQDQTIPMDRYKIVEDAVRQNLRVKYLGGKFPGSEDFRWN